MPPIHPGSTLSGADVSASPAATADVVMADDRRTYLRNRVSWGAILAGVAAALVTQVLLNMLGIALGASSISAANTADNPSASGLSLTAAIWWAVSGILAALLGGIVAGRLCGTSDDNTARWHGFVAWAATTLVVLYLLTSAVGGLVGGALNVLGSTASALGRGATQAVSGVASATDGDALQARVRQLVDPNSAQSAQDDVLAYIRASIGGDQQAADAARDKAVNSVARAANISPDEARTRLTQAEQQARQAADAAKQKAVQAAEATRKAAATAGLAGFVALLLGALASWFGGGLGAPRREASVIAAQATSRL